ncbi:diacylglycerol kinase family lipid kinase [Roseomonas sp. M0104]|uniref:Diacylglycerol kinase family lipid kinase n=1 Tax=Teichococcus coralli TaxID=2545983 RepID=A0A845BAJ9_9PROT|nr:diacylglycerol kinase family protein [Pseudoroseomonas coralli]MXP63114.1 diacylglycerol kinase family lipid kinase [Pseudoroseomonas coralli]
MRIRVIINAGGGSVGGEDISRQLTDAFAQHGVEASVAEVEGPALRDAVEAALGEPWDGVVVGGGDGTIGTAAGLVAGTERPFGVLPLGTRNHFAKDLGLPLEVKEAVAVIAGGHLRSIDVARINDRIFVNNATVGLYADIVRGREYEQERHRLPKNPATVLATLRALWRFTRHRLAVRAEGWGERLRTPLVFIGNNLYSTSLPNPGRRCALDKGELCLCIARHHSRLGILRMFVRALRGRLREDRDFEMRSVTAVEIRSHRRSLSVTLDGEVLKMQSPLECRSWPGALRVFAPPPPSPTGG